MRTWKWLWRIVVGILALGGLGIVVLLVYYRPTIEYAYIDVRDQGQVAAPGWLIAVFGASLALLIGGGLAWLRRKANPRG
jgi:hypothetical protein